MADYEHAKKMLASIGAQPHEITKTIRESQEHESNGDELFRYAKEIMGLDGYSLVWSMARALHAAFKELDSDPQRDMKIQIVLGTIMMALRARREAEAKEETPEEDND